MANPAVGVRAQGTQGLPQCRRGQNFERRTMSHASEGEKEEHEENVPLTFSRRILMEFDGNQQLGVGDEKTLLSVS